MLTGGGSNEPAAAGVQVNDSASIPSGFSSTVQGTYTVVAVAPNYFEIETTNALPLDVTHATHLRVAFAGLWTVADREGRFKWSAHELKLDCLPYDAVNFNEVLDQLVAGEEPFIIRYEIEGRQYGYIPGFTTHQRPHHTEMPSILPVAPGVITVKSPLDDGDDPDGREGNRKGREQEGKGTETDVSGYSPEFEAFWIIYPRKTAKGAAWKAWQKAKPTIELRAKIAEAVAVQAKSDQWSKDGGQFIPHASTWLNQRRWDDELKNTGRVGSLVKGGAAPIGGKYAR